MQTTIGLLVAFIALVSALAIYPHLKFEQGYFSTWWIVARAMAIPYIFISLRVAVGHTAGIGRKILLAIGYYASVLGICYWFLAPRYPLLEAFMFAIIGVFPLIFIWGNPQTPSKPTDVGNNTAVRDA
jgi:hypothetical protein